MKIYFFTSVLAGGGAERVLCQLANKFSLENDVTLIGAYQQDGEYYTNEFVKKAYIDNSIKNKDSWRQIKILRQMIQKDKPDVCISFLPEPNFKMLLAAIGSKTKVIISIRNDPNREYAYRPTRILAKILYPLASGVVFQTEDAKTWFSKRIQNKSEIIMNQVDQIFFDSNRISEDYWVATGRLNKQKNYPLMLRAFRRLVDKHPREKLRIYGQGQLEKELHDLIDQLQLRDNVKLMGQTENVVDVLSHAKAFLLSSDYEGMPNGLLEALAMGLPCVATDCPCGGPREVIKPMLNGILVPVNDEDAFVNGLLMIMENSKATSAIAVNAKEKSKEFLPDVIYEKWDRYIRNIVNNYR